MGISQRKKKANRLKRRKKANIFRKKA